MTSSNLVVPLAVWGPTAPTHCVSSLLMLQDESHVLTGCNDGQICIWDRSPDGKLSPHCMLYGHTAAVTCLTIGSALPDKHLVVSSSDNGEMCLWDIDEGRCVETTKTQAIHTSVQAYQMLHCRDIRLVCNGYYPEIHVVHPGSLEILFSLASRIQPDWISALCILRPVKREDDIVVAISNSGTVKVWTLAGKESKTAQPIYEDEAKQIRCLNAQTLKCCAYNQRTVLIVCSKYWQIYDTNFVERSQPDGDEDGIYDAGDFSLLCSESNRRGERWIGGDFISIDRVLVWSNEGKGYLFKLPANAIPDSESYRKLSNPSNPRQSGPQAYSVLDMYLEKPLVCCPAMTYFHGRREREHKLLLRGDSEGRVTIWTIPDISDSKLKLVRQESFDKLPVVQPSQEITLQDAWQQVEPKPEGLIDHLNYVEGRLLQITATIFVPGQGRLFCGREDGSIVCVSAIEAVVLLLMESGKEKDNLQHQVMRGHNGRINCLLYPFNLSTRYDPNHLLSGGMDFTVCLWDISNGNKLHTFSVHGGEITQLLVPPPECNVRVLPCVCSVASDHSLALLSLKERKCIMLASRQLFPIQVVKWRPLDDFLVIGCTDGTVYVWQMETGHLDRVVHGIAAEDILAACDEKWQAEPTTTTVNPTISLAQAFKRHNLATFRNFAQQRLHNVQGSDEPSHGVGTPHASLLHRANTHPMLIQGLKANTKDTDSHVIFFDTEAMIIQLLNEEYALMSPDTLASHGLSGGPCSQVAHNAGDSQKKIAGAARRVSSVLNMASHLSTSQTKVQHIRSLGHARRRSRVYEPLLTDEAKKQLKRRMSEPGPAKPTPQLGVAVLAASQVPVAMEFQIPPFMAKVKDKAENVGQKLQAKAESAGLKPSSPRLGRTPPPRPGQRPKHIAMQKRSLVMSMAQQFVSAMHAWGHDRDLDKACLSKLGLLQPRVPLAFGLLSRGSHMALLLPGWHRKYEPGPEAPLPVGGHWHISSAVTTQHLLSMIAVANTLMSMSYASFLEEFRAAGSRRSSFDQDPERDAESNHQAQLKQGWSLLAALHCVLLPDLIGRQEYHSPLLEMLARRWQDRCLEIREAAQALLLAELRRIGPEGRKQVCEDWSPYLPSYVDPALSLIAEQQGQSQPPEDDIEPNLEDEDHILGDIPEYHVSQSFESRRKQATAIVMMGVLGAEFGQEIEPNRRKSMAPEDKSKGQKVVEGFGLTNYSHARHTSKALTFLVLQPASPKLPAYSPIRRAAIDLLGRGFTVWEPYLDVSAVLLGLLELCVDGERLVPSMTFGLPLTPQADACRTARHALSLIATARPPAFIITMAKEVARYNAMAQNAQTPNTQLNNSVLVRAKPEILRVIELLVDKIPNDVADLLVEVMDVTVHCLDAGAVKIKGLQEVFPAICRFSMVSYCSHTRRIGVGARNGGLAFYELKQAKCQIVPAHKGPVSAACFSPDGKYLASFSNVDARVMFFQTASTSLFGIGAQTTRCVKSCPANPIMVTANMNPLKLARLIWTDSRTVVLLTVDGSETPFKV